jgi:hypothetical protein
LGALRACVAIITGSTQSPFRFSLELVRNKWVVRLQVTYRGHAVAI